MVVHLASCLVAVVVSGAVAAAPPPVVNGPLAGFEVFPADNWWNHDISAAPVDSASSQIIDWISGRTPSNPGAIRRLHPNFGPHREQRRPSHPAPPQNLRIVK